MAYELYWISGSPYAWRALLALAVKGVEYESKLLNASEGEHKTPAYLAMNPRGKVPVLKDGDTAVYESLAILAYLDAKHPEPPLFGRTAEETARVWQAASEATNYLREASTKLLMPVLMGKTEEQADEMKAGAEETHEELAYLEKTLAESPFLAGDKISAADLVAFPVVQYVYRASTRAEELMADLGFAPMAEHYPNVDAWVKRIEALPGYDKTYPPHWREG